MWNTLQVYAIMFDCSKLQDQVVFIAEQQRVGELDLQHLSGAEGCFDSVEVAWPHIMNLINSLVCVFSLGAGV